jgi:hypothetical protein
MLNLLACRLRFIPRDQGVASSGTRDRMTEGTEWKPRVYPPLDASNILGPRGRARCGIVWRAVPSMGELAFYGCCRAAPSKAWAKPILVISRGLRWQATAAIPIRLSSSAGLHGGAPRAIGTGSAASPAWSRFTPAINVVPVELSRCGEHEQVGTGGWGEGADQATADLDGRAAGNA